MRVVHTIVAIAAMAVWVPANSQVTDAQVEERIQALKASILKSQEANGSWSRSSSTVGVTALCLQALVQADVPVDDRAIIRAARFLSKNSDKSVYSESLVAVALEEVDPKSYAARIRKAANYLEATQLDAGNWSYSLSRQRGGDNSNTQFAALGLGAAQRAGIPLNPATLQRARNHWLSTQNRDGSWGYASRGGGTFSMTCAGLASLKVLGLTYAKRDRSCTPYKLQTHMHKALQWLITHLRSGRALSNTQKFYALYALERVALYLEVKTFDGFDWYRWGAETILKTPLNSMELHQKAFAMLFLAKGSAPIAIAKCQWDGDWNNQRQDVANWCKLSGKDLGLSFDWLASPITSLDAPAAKASVLFITGTQAMTLSNEQSDFLKAFLDQGGTVVAEKSCDTLEFVRSFKREVEAKLYPGLGARWEPLTANHPICTIKHQVSVDDIGGYGFRIGCKRVNLLLLGRNISCALNGDPDMLDDRERAGKIATNVLAWAIKQKAAEKKLDDQKLAPPKDMHALTVDQIERKQAKKTLNYNQPFGRLKHRGIWYAANSYFETLNKLLGMREQFPKFDAEVYISATSDDLFNAAVVLVTGYENPMVTQEEALSLRSYIHNGGVVFGANACSSVAFDKGFRLMVKRIFPNDSLQTIPQTDPLYAQPFDLKAKKAEGTGAYTDSYKQQWAPLQGIKRDGRWVLIYSPVDLTSDISDGLHESVEGYKRESAAMLSVNILTALLTP